MRFSRKDIYEEKCESFDYVYISTNCETLITTIYDKFFEHDEFFDRIFTRSSWLIHEASHVSGLGAEAGSEVFDNAECYRKLACLICDVATFEELYPQGNLGKTLPLKSNIGRKEFPGPDQPRGKDGKWEPKNPEPKDKYDKNPESKPDDQKDPIDINKFYKEIGFDPNGLGENATGLLNPLDALSVLEINNEARSVTSELFPNQISHNNEGDAFRHAYFNYRLSEKIGSSEAKKFGDAHERSDLNELGERAMDLKNNQIGRDLYDKNQTSGKDAAKNVVMNALKNGLLKTYPYAIK